MGVDTHDVYADPLKNQHSELQTGIKELEKQLMYLQQLQDDDVDIDMFPDITKPVAIKSVDPIDNLDSELKKLTLVELNKEVETQREAERQREDAWRKELADREKQLQVERERERERRAARQKEREDWEKSEKLREEERLLKEWELKEQMMEEEREKEWEEEQHHEHAREEAFRQELQWEKDKQKLTAAAMDHQHKAAEERLTSILEGHTLQDPEELDVSRIVKGIDNKMLEEEKQRITVREQIRKEALKKERERQRELERQWQDQVAHDSTAEEEAMKMKEKLAVGQFMDLNMLKKVKHKIFTEAAKAEIPAYLVSCVMRTLEEEPKSRESVFNCTHILCCLLHGPDMNRKRLVCESMATCAYGIRPLVRVMNQFHHDEVIMSHIMCILKLASTSSRKFSAHALAAGGFDVANTTALPGLQRNGFMELTYGQARNYASEARLTVQAIIAMLEAPSTSIMHLIHGLEKLKVTLANTDVEEVSRMDIPELLFDIAERLPNEEYIITEVLKLCSQKYLLTEVAMYMITMVSMGDTITNQVMESRGLKFLHVVLKLMRNSSNSRLIQLSVQFLFAVWNIHPSVNSLLLQVHTPAIFVFCADRFAQLKDQIYYEWESLQIGNPNIKDLLKDIYQCSEFSYDLRAYLFDLAVRFSKQQPSEVAANNAIIFLSDNLGIETLKCAFENVQLCREAVLHVLWTMLQNKEKLQYTERFAEEIADCGLLKLIVDFLLQPECAMCMSHTIDVLEFITNEYAEAETYLLQHNEDLDQAYDRACLSVAVPAEGRKRLSHLITNIFGEPPQLQPLESLLDLSGNEPLEVVLPNLLRVKHTPDYVATFRANGYVGKSVQLFETYNRNPEVELLLLEILHGVICEFSGNDTLNGPIADEFCDAGGISKLLVLMERYGTADHSMGEQGWEILFTVFKNGSPPNVSKIREHKELLPLLSITRTGGVVLAHITRNRDLVDILRDVIVNLHVIEDSKLASNLEKSDENGDDVGLVTPRKQNNIIYDSQQVKALAASIYVLTESLAVGITAAQSCDQLSAERNYSEVMKLIDEGGARALCRCLESCCILPESTVSDMLSTLLSLSQLTKHAKIKARGNDARLGGTSGTGPRMNKRELSSALVSDSLLLNPNQTLDDMNSTSYSAPLYGHNSSTHQVPTESFMQTNKSMMLSPDITDTGSIQNKSKEQVRSRIEAVLFTLQAYKYNREISDKCLILLSTVLMAVQSLDMDDIGSRVVRANILESCFTYVWTHGLIQAQGGPTLRSPSMKHVPTANGCSAIKDVLNILFCLCSVEDFEADAWDMGSFDLAYSAYHLCDNHLIKASAVASMSTHGLFNDERRGYVNHMDGTVFALHMLQGKHDSWESSWASMKMLTALSSPNEKFVTQTVGEGLLYIIAAKLSAYNEPRHTKAGAQCLLYLLRCALSYREFIKDNEKNNTTTTTSPKKMAPSPAKSHSSFYSPPTPEAANHTSIHNWLTNSALTAPMELLIYRVTQLFSVHLIDLATIDFTTQYLTTALELISNDINTRMLKANVRKLLTHVLAFEGVTGRIRKDAETCLTTLQQFAELHGFHDFQSQYVRPTVKPAAPLPPDGTLLHTIAIEKNAKRGDHEGKKISKEGDEGDDDEEDDADPNDDSTPFDTQLDEEDKHYLRKIQSREMYHELTSILLTYQPEHKGKAYKLIAQFFAEKAVRLADIQNY